MDEVREKAAKGTAPTCFAKHLLEEQHNLEMTDLEIAYTAGSPFGAGVETVSHPLLSRPGNTNNGSLPVHWPASCSPVSSSDLNSFQKQGRN